MNRAVFNELPGKIVEMPTRDSVPGLAATLKAAREAAGLTQAEAARRSGVARSNVNLYESDSRAPTVKALYLLAAVYGVTVCELLPPPPDSWE